LKLNNIIISYLIFICLLAVPPVLLSEINLGNLLVTNFWSMFLFVSGITFAAILFVTAIQKKNSEMYAQSFLGATTFKLLASLIFVFVFIKETSPEKGIFVADFAYLYFLNMAFEIYGLLRNLRNQNPK
jgi:hypothetical protein